MASISADILALDPSSSKVGYAVMASDGTLIDAGILSPDRVRDEPNVRIAAMHQALLDVLRDHRPTCVVVEDTSGKVGARHGGAGAGLAIHGKAVGYFMAAVKAAGYVPEMVLENTWTRGTPKAKRQARVAAAFRQYRPETDPGGDVADAIGLACYWMTQRKLEEQDGKQ